mgnify:CR=1 FL=1
MKSIIEELYYGNIDAKDIALPEKKRKKELALYDKLKATLSKESDELFEKFIELTDNNYDELMRMISNAVFLRELCLLPKRLSKEKNYAIEP